jgi:uncharacterized protein (DUF342 family)
MENQIENQKATIESLTKKVDALEKELEKSLHPGSESDTTRINNGLVKNEVLSDVIYNTITAAFLPLSVSKKGKSEYTAHYHPWWYLRALLLEHDLFSEEWTKKGFRGAVTMLNDIVESTSGYSVDREALEKLNEHELANSFFGYVEDNDQEKIASVNALIASLEKLIANADNAQHMQEISVDKADLYGMLSVLRIVSSCQKIYAEALPETE